jgi:arsenite methyltransferase
LTAPLSYPFDTASAEFIEVFDELPLWSAPFGLKILEHVTLADYIRVLDVGSGCGFPLIEVAQRAGLHSQVFGVDPWTAGLERIRRKMALLGLKNVQAIQCTAEDLPFEAEFFDVVISNNGFNNVVDQEAAFRECYRTAKPGAQLLFTVNLPETMSSFYAIFKMTLRQTGLESQIEKVKEHIALKRASLEVIRRRLFDSGWLVVREDRDAFTMRFCNGSVMLQHFLIRSRFFPSWEDLIPQDRRAAVFAVLETNLNKRSAREGLLSLEIPYVCFECRKG